MTKPLTIKKFSIKDRQKGETYNMFAFKGHLDETGLSKEFEVKDKKWGGRACTYRVYVEGKREKTKRVCTSHFTSGLELNTGEIAPKLKELANQNPDGYLVFEILSLS